MAIGALVAAASLTILMIWERVVSSPTRVASHLMKPDWFTVAAEIRSPAALSTGMLSPVRAASFTALEPSRITPSTGMLSPGRTTKHIAFYHLVNGNGDFLAISDDDGSLGSKVHQTLQGVGCLAFGASFQHFPTVIRVRIMAADSK